MDLTLRQFNATKLLSANRGGALWWRVGTGKTRIAYAFFATIAKREARNCKFLVVCRREAFEDWIDEARKIGLSDWRFQIAESDSDFCGLLSPLQNTVFIMSHGKLAKMKEDIRTIANSLDGAAFDEGFLYKNSRSQHCKAAHRISEHIGEAIILSGSMMTARNLEDIFGQLYAINQHHNLARTLTDFRSEYMFNLKIGSPNGNGPSCFVNRAGAARRIGSNIRRISSVYFPDNSKRRIVKASHIISPTKNQLSAFKELREWYWLKLKGKDLILKNAPSVIIKCQQISDGWVNMGNDTIISIPSSKMSWLLSRVSELVECGEKVIVWCAFQHSVTLVLQALQKAFPRIGIYSFSGTTKMNRDGWKRNGRICVATEGSGSSINFLKDCAYAIYYSMDFKWLSLQQSQGRTNRHDSKHDTCFYDFLQTKGSLDSHVYKIVHSSQREEQKLIMQSAVESWLNAI